MHLALRMGRTLGELAETLSAAEFDLWVALHNEAPLDDSRADLHAGIIAAAVANFAGKALPEGRSVSPLDFVPFGPEPEEPDPLEHFARFKGGV